MPIVESISIVTIYIYCLIKRGTADRLEKQDRNGSIVNGAIVHSNDRFSPTLIRDYRYEL